MKRTRINLRFAPTKKTFLKGEQVTALVVVHNPGSRNLSQVRVRFFLADKQIGLEQFISLGAGKTKALSTRFTPSAVGEQRLKVQAILSELPNSDRHTNGEPGPVVSATWLFTVNHNRMTRGHKIAIERFKSMANMVGRRAIESVTFFKYNIFGWIVGNKKFNGGYNYDVYEDGDGGTKVTYETTSDGSTIVTIDDLGGHLQITESFKDDNGVWHEINRELVDGAETRIEFTDIGPDGSGIITTVFPDGTSQTTVYAPTSDPDENDDSGSNETDADEKPDSESESGDTDDSGDDTDDSGDDTDDSGDDSDDSDSGSEDFEINGDDGTAMTFDDGGGPEGSDTPSGAYTNPLLLDMIAHIKGDKTSPHFNKVSDPPALVVSLAGDEATAPKGRGMGGHGPDVRWVFSSEGPEANPIDPLDDDQSATGKPHKAVPIPINPLTDPMEMAAIKKANAEMSVSTRKGASMVVASVGGWVQKFTQKGDNKFWAPLKVRNRIGPGSIVRIDNRFGGIVGVGSDFSQAVSYEWQKVSAFGNHTVHIMVRVAVSDLPGSRDQ